MNDESLYDLQAEDLKCESEGLGDFFKEHDERFPDQQIASPVLNNSEPRTPATVTRRNTPVQIPVTPATPINLNIPIPSPVFQTPMSVEGSTTDDEFVTPSTEPVRQRMSTRIRSRPKWQLSGQQMLYFWLALYHLKYHPVILMFNIVEMKQSGEWQFKKK